MNQLVSRRQGRRRHALFVVTHRRVGGANLRRVGFQQ